MAGVLAAALAGGGLVAGATPASAEPDNRAGYVQPDVPRALDVGLLPAIGDRRFSTVETPARDDAGRTFVYVEGASAAEAVEDAGGEVLQTSGNRVRAAVPGTNLVTLAKQDGVSSVRQPDRAFPLAVTSEGVETSGAGAWKRSGKTGAGAKVGVVDIGFDGLADAQAAGEVPANATLHPADCPAENGSSHGTAVTEIVHDMAPGATLFLACAPDSMTFASAVDWMIAQDVDVVAGAVGFPNTGRGDGTGIAGSPAAAVRKARDAGILWVAGAGNQAQLHWGGAAADANADGYVEVGGAAQGNGFTIPAGGTSTVSLRWDAWPTTRQDLDLVVMSVNRRPTGPGDAAIVAQSTNPQADAAEALPPTEQVTLENKTGGAQTYWIYTAARASYPQTKADVFVMGDAMSLSYPVAAGSLLEPATSPYAMAVGASQTGSGAVDAYSSRGPTVDGRTKPDITGPAGVSTYTFGPAPTMAGTSSAAAHVAGAAALLKGANGALDAAALQSLLEARTSPSRYDSDWGHGLLALGAPDTPQTPQTGGFTPVQPIRILKDAPLAAGEVRTLSSTAPAGATAVVLNVTAWGSTTATRIEVYRDADTASGLPTIDLAAGDKRTAMAIVPLSAARTVTIRSDAGAATVNVDLQGYFSPAGAGTYFTPNAPVRLLDTHTATGGHKRPFGAAEEYALQVRGVAGVPDNATSVLLDVTLSENSEDTYVQLYPQLLPDAANVEAGPVSNSVRGNLAVTGIGDDGRIRIRNARGNTALAIDLIGWFAPGTGARYVPLPRTAKVLDTRTGTGAPIGALGQGATTTVSLSGVAGVPRDVAAPVLAVSATGDGAGAVTARPAGKALPWTTGLQGLRPARTTTGTLLPRADGAGAVELRTDAGTTEIVAGVSGYFVGGAAVADPAGSCAVGPEPGFTALYDGRSPLSAEWRAAGSGATKTEANCELTSAPNNSLQWFSARALPAAYTLRLDYRASGAGADAGVMIGSASPLTGSLTEGGGYEVQIKPDGVGTTATGAIESTQAPATGAEKPAGQWNAMEITVNGKRVTVRLNGTVVNDFVATADTRLLDPGFVGLQGSSTTAPVSFRNVRVRVDRAATRFGEIRTAADTCIDVINATRAAGTQFQAIVCKANDAQLFTLPGDGTLRIFGLCVDANGPVRNGANRSPHTATCTGAATQQWQYRADRTLYNAANNVCLDSPTSPVSGSMALWTNGCHGASNQQWKLPTGRAAFGPLVKNGYSNLCLDILNETAAVDAQVQMVNCKRDIGAQQFTLPGDGTLRIYGFCVDQNGPVRSGTDKWLKLSVCTGAASQQWVVRPGDELYNPASNSCMDYAVGSGIRVSSWTCNTTYNQWFAMPWSGVDGTLTKGAPATPVASWAMDENNGTTLADGSGNGRPAALTSGTWTTGHTGAAVEFNGTGTVASTARTALQTNRSYSVSAWAKINPTTGTRTIVSQDGSGRNPFSLSANANTPEWQFLVTQTSASTYTKVSAGAGSMVANRWTHLVGVYDAEAGEIRLYVDGELKGATDVAPLWLAGGNSVVGRGWYDGKATDWFPGAIDDVRLYQGVLTQQEITALSRV
ncbi:ricin-type beta-trefoil lectin domain protein [Catenuloplanes atrovinosus]|uniref:ricin-type beta-trefoil lectin domain protein n=1 Tax=Catenuloplanes atrovinosus TaxID=137266 RepID=UPI00286B2B20|nr:ricin-type beta-trefoil lectin domain protein [Catenuloplanes atrovinosus]